MIATKIYAAGSALPTSKQILTGGNRAKATLVQLIEASVVRQQNAALTPRSLAFQYFRFVFVDKSFSFCCISRFSTAIYNTIPNQIKLHQ